MSERVLAVAPELADAARADREFLRRTVRFLAAEAGVRQFLDVGTGIPTDTHTHQVAQAVDPACRVVYVDHDRLVLAHARALLVSAPQGAVDHIEADLREPELILMGAGHTLDLTQPVAVLVTAVAEFLPDDAQARAAVAHLVEALPSGSFLVLAHLTTDAPNEPDDAPDGGPEPTVGTPAPAERPEPPEAPEPAEASEPMGVVGAVRIWNDSGAPPITPRTPRAVGRFFAGLEVLEPGVVPVNRWRPELDTWCADQELPFHDAVARKP